MEQICPAGHSIAPEVVVTRPSTGLSISTVAGIPGSGVGSRSVSKPADEPPPHAETTVSVDIIRSMYMRFIELGLSLCLLEISPRWIARAKNDIIYYLQDE
jgi:hypothetical protein